MTNKLLKLGAALCVVFAASLSYSQSTALNWHFGEGAKLSWDPFNLSADPVPECNSAITLCTEGSAGVTDAVGNDIFYTNGVTVWDENGVAYAGAAMSGGGSAASTLVIPRPGTTDEYFIVTTDDKDLAATPGINYTIANSTTKTLTSLNTNIVAGPTNGQSEQITAVPKPDGSGEFWLVLVDMTGGNGGATVNSYDVTAAGISSTAISSIALGGWMSWRGYIKTNHSGTKIAIGGSAWVQECDFNPATGALSSMTFITPVGSPYGAIVYGVEYSPTDNILFYTVLQGGDAYLYAHNVGTGVTKTVTATSATYRMGAISLGPDGKLYVVHNNSGSGQENKLAVIDDPDTWGTLETDYQIDGIQWPAGCGNPIRTGIPTFIPALLLPQGCSAPTALVYSSSFDDFCEGESVDLTVTAQPGFTYNFYNGNSLVQSGSNNIYSASTSGTYKVVLISEDDPTDATCRDSATVSITRHLNPDLSGAIVGEDTVCEGTSAGIYEYTGDGNLGSYSSVNWITGLANLNGAIYSNTNNPSTVNFSGVSNFSQVVTLSLYATEVHGVATCISDTVTYDVTVQEIPTLDISPASFDIACNSTDNDITINNYNSSSIYTVTPSDLSISVSQTGNTITFDVGDQDGTITINETTSAGCPSPDVVVAIDVNGCDIEADFDVSVTELCADSVIRLTSTAVAGEDASITSYNWIFNPSAGVTVTGFDNGTPDSSWVEITVSNATTSPATLEVIHTVTNDWGLTDDTVAVDIITINPNPGDIDVTHNGVLCDGDTSVFDVVVYDATSNYTWSSTISQLVQGADSAAYINTGASYTVSVLEENQYGCYGDTATYMVDVEQNPTLVLDPDNQTVNCLSLGNTVSIQTYDPNSTYFVTTSTGTIVTTGPDASGDITFDVGEDAGTIFVTQETANGCISNEATTTVAVIGCGLEADFTVDAAGCSGDTVTFTSTSDPGAGASIITYNWTFPLGLTAIGNTDAATVQAVLSNGTLLNDSMTVSLEIVTDAFLTADTTKANILVIYPLPGGVTIGQSGLICSSESLTFDVTPYNTNSTYDWSTTNINGIASSAADSAVVLNGTSDYVVYVQETSENACVGPVDSLEVTVEEDPTLDFEDELDVACNSIGNIYTIPNYDASSSYNLIDTSGGIVVTITGDEIAFDVLSQDGSFTIQQETANNCTSNIETINVNVLGCGITAIFDVSGGACSGDTVLFDGTASFAGAGDNIIDYNWTFPSGVNPVSYNADSSIVTAVVTNVSSNADTLEVTLDVVSQLGLAADTTQVEAWIVNPLPADPIINMAGNTCPGDTIVFDVTPLAAGLTANWYTVTGTYGIITVNSATDSLVVENYTDDYEVGVQIVDPITGCVSLNDDTEAVNITEAPSIDAVAYSAGRICGFAAVGGTYYVDATVLNADSVYWSSNPDIVNFNNVNADSTGFSVATLDGQSVSITIEAFSDGCGDNDEYTIDVDVDTTYLVDYNIDSVTSCLGDVSTYSVNNIGDYLPDSLVSYTWVLNNEDTVSTTTSVSVTSASLDDYLELYVDADICYDGFSSFYDSIPLPVITRPGGVLVLSGADVEYDGVEDYYVLDGIITLDEDAVELEDDLNAADRFTQDLSDPTLWQFFWLSADDSLIYDGEEGSIDNYIVNSYPAITDATPPNWSAQNYDVTYYMITTNGTCYDTATAVLHVDFDIFIPNVFTPNDDNYFDTWTVENGSKYGPLNVQIYNRWGNLVYNSAAWDNAWTGKNNDGEDLPFGTYFYILETAVEGAPVFRGTVTILK